MKKMIITMLTVMFLYNAILPTHFYESKASSTSEQDITMSGEQEINKIIENSTIVFEGQDRVITSSDAGEASIFTIFFDVINVIPMVASTLISIAAYPEENEESFLNGGEVIFDSVDKWLTVSDIVFGKVGLFDINYGKASGGGSSTQTENDKGMQTSQAEVPEEAEQKDQGLALVNTVKQNVSSWYNAIRSLTIVILLLVLIYIGIRMATSSLADDRSKYKQMLMSWFVSLIMLFSLHYIIFFAINLSEVLMNALGSVSEQILTGPDGEEKNLEEELIVGTKQSENDPDLYQDGKIIVQRTGLIEALKRTNGINIIYLSIMYWVLVYYQVKFFFLYLKRFLTVGFLIVIAPLITVTYSIDKAGDGKAQAFSSWLKEFLVNVFIQPLHAILYIVFMRTAYEIAFLAPLIAVFFLAGLSRGEKVVKELLHIRGLTSIHSMSETMGLKMFKSK